MMNLLRHLNIAAMILSLIGPLLAKRIVDCEKCGLESLLRSPALGIDINTDSLTAVIKNADGSYAQLAAVTVSVELRALMKDWATEPIAVFSDESFVDTPKDGFSLTREFEVLQKPLAALIQEVSIQLPEIDLQHQHYVISLPPFVNARYFHYIKQAASQAGFPATDTGWVGHSDRTTLSAYNALFCIYHIHPHDPLCATDGIEGVFDALVIDYSSSFLTVTWFDTFSPYALRRGGFADGELGGSSVRNSEYWTNKQARIDVLLHSIEEDRRPDDGENVVFSEVGPNQLVFLGELGADELLRRFLHDAFVGSRFAFHTVTIHDSYDSVFASGIGAAMAAKAVMDAPEPGHCHEPHECRELRERVYEEACSNPKNEL